MRISKHGARQKREDEKTYKIVFDSSDHHCEECGVFVGDVFATEGGAVLNRWRYSHILPKSIYGRFRNNPKNFNTLCYHCHQIWGGTEEQRVAMNIYNKNQITINELKGA